MYAHSVNGDGERHDLVEHLRGTAERARRFADVFGAGELADYLGLVHDVGKATCAWQAGLMRAEPTQGSVGLDHKLAGTWLAARRGVGPLAAVVFGHHGGLPSASTLKAAVIAADGSEREVVAEAVAWAGRRLPAVGSPGRVVVPAWLEDRPDPLAAELLVRMVFGAVVDADFLDTEQHFHRDIGRHAAPSVATLATSFEQAREKYLPDGGSSVVNGIRAEVYERAVEAAGLPPGVFRLPAPTGSGKTIAVAGFGVRHAERHGLRRVVVAVPFLSITQQNAKVYRELLGDEYVLEHHSGVNLDTGRRRGRWQRLAAENWDAPFVVTTTVQLFESLFSNRPGAMRKLHRLANSVIVLDEVQALPDGLLAPILSALRHLTEYFGVTVLLASATQPAFFDLKPFQDLQVRDVIPKPERLYRTLRRVRYEWWLSPKPTLAQVAERAAGERQVLLIANTTADAARLHHHLAARWRHDGPVLHLSTRMTAAHRSEVLEQIRERLDGSKGREGGRPVAVVSTQLVEAGVDLDFPLVLRAFAPAEALQQAAGRCNRNGLLAEGLVIVFDPADGDPGAWAVYGAATTATRRFFGPERAFPDDIKALERYYIERYKLKGNELASCGDVDEMDEADPSVGAVIEELRCDLDFPEVARLFKMIDERTVPIIAPYGDEKTVRERRSLLAMLRSADPVPGWVFRRLQPHLASIPRSAVAEGSLHPVWHVVGDLWEWRGAYHPQRGIELQPLEKEISS